MGNNFDVQYIDYKFGSATTGTALVASPGTGKRIDVDGIWSYITTLTSGFVQIGYGADAATGSMGASVPVFYTEGVNFAHYELPGAGENGLKAQPISIAVSGTVKGHVKLGYHVTLVD